MHVKSYGEHPHAVLELTISMLIVLFLMIMISIDLYNSIKTLFCNYLALSCQMHATNVQ